MGELILFRTKESVKRGWEPEPRHTRRLADRLTLSFYEACRIGNLDAAWQFMTALEFEVERTSRTLHRDSRDDGHDTIAVRERYELERRRQQRIGTVREPIALQDTAD